MFPQHSHFNLRNTVTYTLGFQRIQQSFQQILFKKCS